MLTADTITDAQIRELRLEAQNAGNSWRELVCNDALGTVMSDRLPARAHLANILNARSKEHSK